MQAFSTSWSQLPRPSTRAGIAASPSFTRVSRLSCLRLPFKQGDVVARIVGFGAHGRDLSEFRVRATLLTVRDPCLALTIEGVRLGLLASAKSSPSKASWLGSFDRPPCSQISHVHAATWASVHSRRVDQDGVELREGGLQRRIGRRGLERQHSQAGPQEAPASSLRQNAAVRNPSGVPATSCSSASSMAGSTR